VDLSELPVSRFAPLAAPARAAWMVERYGPGRTLAATADAFMADLSPHVEPLAELVRTDPRTRGSQLQDLLRRRSDGAIGEVILVSDLPQRTYCRVFGDGAQAGEVQPACVEHFRTAAAAFLTARAGSMR
jgi:hypothetical protein